MNQDIYYGFDRTDIEELILGMADIVSENRRLRRELKEANAYQKNYNDLLSDCVDHANKSTANLFNAIMSGVFATKE